MTTLVAIPPCDAGQILSGPVAAACSPAVGRWTLTATILGSSMVFIDSSAVNVVLPVLQRGLGASATQVQWVIEIYLLFLASLILAGGALSDQLGHRRVFMGGVAAFAIASLMCGAAWSPTALIVGRALQGIAGAVLVPGSLALISASVDEASRGRAIGTWSGFTAITSAAGPVVGGWLATNLSWRWVFFLNLPFAIAVLVIAAARVPDARAPSTPRRVDWKGALLSVSGLGLLVYGLIESANLGLTRPLIVGTIAAGVLVLAAFAWVEKRAASPMMPLDLFRSRSFTGANLLTFLLYGALGGTLYFLPFNLIQVHGYTPTEAGAAWLPFILPIAILSRWTGALVPLAGPRVLLVAGPLVTAAGFALALLPGTGGSYWTTFFPALLVMGIGMSIAVAPLVTVVLGAVERSRAGIASGINNAASRAAGLLVLAVMGSIVLGVFNRELDRRLAGANVRPSIQAGFADQRSALAAAEPPKAATPEEGDLLRRAIDESFVAAFRVAMLIASGLAVGGALVAWRTIDGAKRA